MNTGHDPTETAKGKTAKGTGKSDRNAAKMKTAAKAASEENAPRLNVATAQKMNMRLNIDYTRKIRHAQI